MKKVFMIHGLEGSPNGGWRPWLMAELEKHNIYACSLFMPKPNQPALSEWLEELHRVVESNPDDELYLVGHSLGGTLLLRYLENYDSKNIKGIVTVSAVAHKAKTEKLGGFINDDFDLKTIASRVPSIVAIHGDNDEFVSVSDAEAIEREAGGKLIIIPNGGHLNGSAGFFQLPELLDSLLEMMKIK